MSSAKTHVADSADSTTWRHLANMIGLLVTVAVVIDFVASHIAG